MSPIKLAVVVMLVGAPSVARADDPPFTIGSQPAWFLLGGVTGGGTVAVDTKGGFVGAELSLARLRDASFVGFYTDAYYDFGIDGTYVTGGLEIGRKFLGIDLGPALRFAGGTRELGAAARVTVGVGMFGLYARYAVFDAMTDKNVIQVGAMLKLPLVSPFGGN